MDGLNRPSATRPFFSEKWTRSGRSGRPESSQRYPSIFLNVFEIFSPNPLPALPSVSLIKSGKILQVSQKKSLSQKPKTLQEARILQKSQQGRVHPYHPKITLSPLDPKPCNAPSLAGIESPQQVSIRLPAHPQST